MMSNLVGLIFIMSVVASVIFGIVLLLEYIYQTVCIFYNEGGFNYLCGSSMYYGPNDFYEQHEIYH